MYKGWSKVMHGVSTLNSGSVATECNTEYIAVGFDALRSTIGRSAMRNLSEYFPLVADCI